MLQSSIFSTRDYRNAAVIGFIIGLFLLPTVRNLAGQHVLVYIASIVGFPLLGIVIIFISKNFLENYHAVFEFIKFGITGTANTAINLGILNSFVFATGITKGLPVILFTAVAFSCSIANSYYWNAHWSFKNTNARSVKEFLKFAAIMIVGLALNSGIVYGITRISPLFGLSPKLWINAAEIVATLIVLFWNFFGFRLVVFKTPATTPQINN